VKQKNHCPHVADNGLMIFSPKIVGNYFVGGAGGIGAASGAGTGVGAAFGAGAGVGFFTLGFGAGAVAPSQAVL
jgi:hypothetical protein